MAVIGSERPMTHPKAEAISPTIAVTSPMKQRAMTKHAHPLSNLGGGMKAKKS